MELKNSRTFINHNYIGIILMIIFFLFQGDSDTDTASEIVHHDNLESPSGTSTSATFMYMLSTKIINDSVMRHNRKF